RTVGYVPAETRAERVEKTYAISEFAKGLGVDAIAAHIGFVPEDHNDPLFGAMVETMRNVADYAAKNGQIYSLETGQETAEGLLEFLKAVDRDNVKINFDPANMILYGTAEPLPALVAVKDYIASVHAKDGKWSDKPGETWGVETPLGEGDVNMEAFVATLKEIGFDGYITIEREISGDKQVEDLRAGVSLLRGLVAG
ncbi:MAG: sugar phosphate isomerase/epimerase, partial [Candidatus Poribacteria bacterium]|nr:sugar phosphate isomerase/epimerase [Candidatus Poribacteria bacterium]